MPTIALWVLNVGIVGLIVFMGRRENRRENLEKDYNEVVRWLNTPSTPEDDQAWIRADKRTSAHD